LPEEALIAALAEDLDSSFERLVLAYQARLYGFALRQTGGNPQDAEEVAQDAFVRAYRALQTYPPERVRDLALRPWLYQITLNVARNRHRRRHVLLVPLDGEGDDSPSLEPAAAEAERPEAIASRLERGAELAALVADLPGRFRTAVVLRHVEGLTYGEVAQVLGQPVGTVKANVHRGIRLLRDALTESENAVHVVAGTPERRNKDGNP
jgi:RNA polymerase sigma-70 factor, ECF subfamily